MRFPRNAKIFRGQIDAAPFAGLFFLLVLMLLLYGSNTFIPGIRIDLAENQAAEPAARTLAIDENSRITYQGKDYDLKEFDARVREQAQAGKLPGRLRFVADPKASRDTVAQVKRIAQEMSVALRPPGQRMELPEFAGFPGSAGPSVVVGVNLNGQAFFRQQLVNDEMLGRDLAALAAKEPGVIMILQADRAVRNERLQALYRVAAQAGISEIRLADRPR